MKRLIIAIASACVSCMLYGATAQELASLPTDKINASNVDAVLDAALATTNNSTFIRALDAKAIDASGVLAKIDSNPYFINAAVNAITKYGGTVEQRIAVFNSFANAWADLDKTCQFSTLNMFMYLCYANSQPVIAIADKASVAKACQKIASSNADGKFLVLSQILFAFGQNARQHVNDLCQQYYPMLLESIETGDFYSCKHGGLASAVSDIAQYAYNDINDIAAAKRIISRNVEIYSVYKKINIMTGIPVITQVNKNLEPELTALRTQFLDSIAESDYAFMTVAFSQDKTDGNKNTTAAIYSKLKDAKNKVDIALYLNDNDKLVDALAKIDDTIEPQTMNKIILILNSFDPDYRPTEVLKALKVINKKYTLKLYDNHDTWEPILSKVRALIDVYK